MHVATGLDLGARGAADGSVDEGVYERRARRTADLVANGLARAVRVHGTEKLVLVIGEDEEDVWGRGGGSRGCVEEVEEEEEGGGGSGHGAGSCVELCAV